MFFRSPVVCELTNKHLEQIDKASSWRSRFTVTSGSQTRRSSKSPDEHRRVILVYGKSGLGKTTFAELLGALNKYNERVVVIPGIASDTVGVHEYTVYDANPAWLYVDRAGSNDTRAAAANIPGFLADPLGDNAQNAAFALDLWHKRIRQADVILWFVNSHCAREDPDLERQARSIQALNPLAWSNVIIMTPGFGHIDAVIETARAVQHSAGIEPPIIPQRFAICGNSLAFPEPDGPRGRALRMEFGAYAGNVAAFEDIVPIAPPISINFDLVECTTCAYKGPRLGAASLPCHRSLAHRHSKAQLRRYHPAESIRCHDRISTDTEESPQSGFHEAMQAASDSCKSITPVFMFKPPLAIITGVLGITASVFGAASKRGPVQQQRCETCHRLSNTTGCTNHFECCGQYVSDARVEIGTGCAISYCCSGCSKTVDEDGNGVEGCIQYCPFCGQDKAIDGFSLIGCRDPQEIDAYNHSFMDVDSL